MFNAFNNKSQEWSKESLDAIFESLNKIQNPPLNDKKYDPEKEFDKLLANPDLQRRVLEKNNALKAHLESHRSFDSRPLLTSAVDSIMNAWFSYHEAIAMNAGKLPKDGHDIKEDYWEYAMALGSEMHNHRIVRLLPEHTDIWDTFISNDDEGVSRSRDVCPLIKDKDGYRLHPFLVDYFATKLMLQETLANDTTTPENDGGSPRLG